MATVNYLKDSWVEVTFEPGDTVRLISGNSPQRVLFVRMRKGVQYLICEYFSNAGNSAIHGHQKPRIASDYVLLRGTECPSESQPKETAMTKLYQTKTEPVQYGIFLTRNTLGQLVLEMKGAAGEVKAFNESDLEEVVPYTVKLCPLNSNTSVIVEMPKGSVEKHDIIIAGSHIYIVGALDVKLPSTKNISSFRRFQGVLVTLAGAQDGDDDGSTQD